MANKNTKRTMYNEIMEAMADNAEVVAFCQKELDHLDKQAQTAKAYKAKKQDALRIQVYSCLTDNYQTAEDIAAEIGDENITKAKVTAKLTALVRDNMAVKANVKVDGRRLMGYALPTTDNAADLTIDA